MKNDKTSTLLALALVITHGTLLAQRSAGDQSVYNEVKTYVNPVLPGDHPDPTMLRVGDDFYHCGSSFHFTPYLPIYHSKDMVHWEVISRVVPPTASTRVDTAGHDTCVPQSPVAARYAWPSARSSALRDFWWSST